MEFNQYRGFHPESSLYQLDKVSLCDISSQEFYERYVRARKPCILVHQQGSLFNALNPQESGDACPSDKRDDLLLRNWLKRPSFAEQEVQVESVDEERGGFGSAQTRHLLTIKDLYQRLRDGQELYMTTQYQKEEEETNQDPKSKEVEIYCAQEFKKLLMAPLPAILDQIPLIPRPLDGYLIPQQINMWLGANQRTEGLSSGLHHDFHDNLYALLSGRKRFTLFSPRDAPFMYTEGEIHTIHSNGLITYFMEPLKYSDELHSTSAGSKLIRLRDEAALIRADGARIDDVLEWEIEVLEFQLEEMSSMRRKRSRKGKAAAIVSEEVILRQQIEEMREKLQELRATIGKEGDEEIESDFEQSEEEFGGPIDSGFSEEDIDNDIESLMEGKVVVYESDLDSSAEPRSKRSRFAEVKKAASENDSSSEISLGDSDEVLFYDEQIEETGVVTVSLLDDDTKETIEVINEAMASGIESVMDSDFDSDNFETESEQDTKLEFSDEEEEEEEIPSDLGSAVEELGKFSDEEISDSDDENIDWNKEDDFQDNDACEEKKSEPVSFSRIPLPALYHFLQRRGLKQYSENSDDSLDSEDWEEHFPLLNYATPISVTLEAGECLYLPASWFHEVASFGTSSTKSIHMAINYWFHPPSNIVDDEASEPYEDAFWEYKYQLARVEYEERLSVINTQFSSEFSQKKKLGR